MFNVVINNEQYDEYLAQKARIKELEARNEFLKTQYDQLNSLHQEALSEKAVLKDENDVYKNEIKDLKDLVDTYRQKAIIANGMYHHEHIKNNEHTDLNEKIKALEEQNNRLLEKAKQVEASDGICEKLMNENDELKEKIKALEASNALLKGNLESTYGNYQQSLSVKAALIKERNELINERSELYIENEALKNKNIRFKELVTDNYRLQMSNNDLKANNKELKKQNDALKDAIAEMAEKATNPDYVKFLEAVKKFQEYDVAAHLDVLEEYQPACNLNIENLYVTNNYFSEEDEDNE